MTPQQPLLVRGGVILDVTGPRISVQLIWSRATRGGRGRLARQRGGRLRLLHVWPAGVDPGRCQPVVRLVASGPDDLRGEARSRVSSSHSDGQHSDVRGSSRVFLRGLAAGSQLRRATAQTVQQVGDK